MKLYKYIQVFSLDVVAGACISSIYLSYLLNSQADSFSLISLGIAVWLIYTADHLWDAKKNERPSTFRHYFHRKYFKVISSCWGIIATGGVVSLFYIPAFTLKIGIVALLVVVFYFILLAFPVKRALLLKEPIIALLYTIGVFIPFLTPQSNLASIYFWLLAGLYFLMALINVLTFSIFDEQHDKKDGHASIVIAFGNKKILKFAKILWGLGILVLGAIFVYFGNNISLFGIMFMILGVLLFKPVLFQNNDIHRALGDGIFIIPLFSFIS